MIIPVFHSLDKILDSQDFQMNGSIRSAETAGATINNFAGIPSIPADLLRLSARTQAQRQIGAKCGRR